MRLIFYAKIWLAFAVPLYTSAQMRVHIVPVWGNTILTNKTWYKLSSNDSLTITAFSCYLAKFNGDKAYHLVDAFNPNSLDFDIPASVNGFIEFEIGVDSLISTAGVLEGDLDPALGMYWAWNTGYIHAKLQGYSNQSKDPHQEFEFHIGGYLQPYCPVKKVKIKCEVLNNRVVLFMDAKQWFLGPYPIDLSKLYHVVEPGRAAMEVSENYKLMFRVQ